MDKKNVQKQIPRYLFAQKRAALGKIFGAFGRSFATAFMVQKYQKQLLVK